MALRLRFKKTVPAEKSDTLAGKIPGLLAEAATRDQEAASTSRKILEKITGGTPLQKVGVRFWTGDLWPNDEPRAATIVLNHPGALRAMLSGGSEDPDAFHRQPAASFARSENAGAFRPGACRPVERNEKFPVARPQRDPVSL
jgi:hypothetical protein